MPELTDVEERLAAAVSAGEELDLRGAPDRDIRAEVLRELLLDLTRPRGVRLRGARVVGRVDLEGRQLGELRLLDCELADPFWLRGASVPLVDLRGCALAGLNLSEATVGRVLLLGRVRSEGRIDLDGARLGGSCSLRAARLNNPRGPALVADRLRLSSELVLEDLVAAGVGEQGAVSLVGARIDGRLAGRRLHVGNPDGPALVADNLQVADTIDLSQGARLRGTGSRGALRIVGARASSLSLGRARLENPSGWALAAHYLGMVGTVYLDQAVAAGGIRLSGSTIGGQVDLTGARVDGGDAGPALAGTRLQVSQAVVLHGAVLRSSGERPTVDLRSARIAGDLELRGARLANPAGPALRVSTATVEGRLILTDLTVERGEVDLRDSTVGTLHDDPAAVLAERDGRIALSGLTYRGLPGRPGVTVGQRIDWLRRMPDYEAQPYRQLATAYQAAGHPEDARRILVAQQEHLRDSGALAGWALARHGLFGLTLQYGYQPLRAVALLAATLLAAMLLFLGVPDGTEVTAGGGRCAAVDRIGLAIDTAVPLATTGAAERCALATRTGSGQALAAAGWVLTLLGWGSATLVVVGYTGLVRRS